MVTSDIQSSKKKKVEKKTKKIEKLKKNSIPNVSKSK